MIEIKEIPLKKRELKKFVEFANTLYKGNDCYVPPLLSDDVNTLRPEGNPAFDFCESACWMAYRDGPNLPHGNGTVLFIEKQ